MKTVKKVFIGLVVFLLVAGFALFLIVKHVARKALPDYSQPVELAGLKDVVHVYRDAFAIPHVFAANEHDLYMTVGYLMAQDRLWQMDLLRRVTTGRLSEIFGADMIGSDQLLRALRIPEKSEMVLAQSEEKVLHALEAFSSGVNQYIEKAGNRLPPEFTILGYRPEPWEPAHSANLIGYMAWDLSGSWTTEVVLQKLRSHLQNDEKFFQLVPNLNRQLTYVHPAVQTEEPGNMFSLLDNACNLHGLGLEVFSASNSWAVAGGRSETGNALLANDMHLGFGAPGIWYQIHKVVEGKLKVQGVALPGQPFVIVGNNEKIAWGMTNVYVDDIDFYAETIQPNDSAYYLLNEQWLPLEIREEKIAVKGGDTVIRKTRFTHRGPIISGFRKYNKQAISMRWTGNEFSDELRSIYLLNRAGNWEEFRNAVRTMMSVSQNITYADIHGNIGIQTTAGVPLRKGNPIFIFPGETDEFDWTGMLPFEELPHTFNPAEGVVSSANNRTTGPDYPHYIGHWFDISARIDRIRNMLAERQKHSPDDFKRILADFNSEFAGWYRDDIVEIISAIPDLTALEKSAVEELTQWDLEMGVNSAAAAIFEKFYIAFLRNTLADEMGDELYGEFGGMLARHAFGHLWANRESPWFDDINTQNPETFTDIAGTSFRQTTAWLSEKLGSEVKQWEWGNIHQLTIAHPMGTVNIIERIFDLNRGPFPVGGSFHTVNPFGYSFRNPFASIHGASQRHIHNMGDLSETLVVIPTGTSGIPASKYYGDQTGMFLENRYRNVLWDKEEVIAEAKYHATFSPTVQ
ncbi:MAG TPA: penicillin acylase family protein [Bacteroidales bacterium]|nr:penicillin acylase family protein [Bacteroidales bacterium]